MKASSTLENICRPNLKLDFYIKCEMNSKT